MGPHRRWRRPDSGSDPFGVTPVFPGKSFTAAQLKSPAQRSPVAHRRYRGQWGGVRLVPGSPGIQSARGRKERIPTTTTPPRNPHRVKLFPRVRRSVTLPSTILWRRIEAVRETRYP